MFDYLRPHGLQFPCLHQASLSFTISQSLLKFVSIELVMLSNHFIFCRPFLLLPSIFPSTRVFSSESALSISWPEYWRSVVPMKPLLLSWGLCCRNRGQFIHLCCPLEESTLQRDGCCFGIQGPCDVDSITSLRCFKSLVTRYFFLYLQRTWTAFYFSMIRLELK